MNILIELSDASKIAVVIENGEIVDNPILKDYLQSKYDKGEYIVISDSVPQVEIREIDARRLRLALLQLGKLATVKAAIASLGEAAQIDWEYATFVKEDYPLVMALSTNLGLDINAIFTKAESLE